MSVDNDAIDDLYKLEDLCHEDAENVMIPANQWAEFEDQVAEQADGEERQILEYIQRQALSQKRLRRLSRLPSSRLHSKKRNRCRPRMFCNPSPLPFVSQSASR
jgi:hypothetical protein